MTDSTKVKEIWSGMTPQEKEQYSNSLSEDQFQQLKTSLTGQQTTSEPNQAIRIPAYAASGIIKGAASVPMFPIEQSVAEERSKSFFPTAGETQARFAGVGSNFAEMGNAIKQLVTAKSPEEAQQIASTFREEESLRRRLGTPEEQAAYRGGRAESQVGTTLLGMRAIPSPSDIGLGIRTGAGILRNILPTAGRIGYGSLVGGTYPALTTVTAPEQTKAEQFAQGAAFGGLLSTGAEVIGAAARPLASKFATKAESVASGGMLRENPAYETGQKLSQETRTQLTPGQLTGSDFLSGMSAPTEFANKQAKQTMRYFISIRDELSSSPKTAPELANSFDRATDNVVSRMKAHRSAMADINYERFKKSVKEIYTDNTMAKFEQIAKPAVPGTEEGKLIVLKDKFAAEFEASGGSLTTEQLLGWQKRFSSMMKGKSDIFKDMDVANQRRLGGELMDALYADVKNTADILEKQGSKSPATLLRRAASAYEADTSRIRKVQDSALGAIFGKYTPGGATKVTPEIAGQKLMNLSPSEFKAVQGVLKEYHPDLVKQYQATKLYDAMQTGVKLTRETAGRPPGMTHFNPQNALGALGDKKNLRPVFENDPETMRRVNNGLSLLTRISERMSVGTGKQAVGSRAGELMRNITSLNEIFAAGTAGKMLGPIGLWKLTTSDSGINLLKTVASSPMYSPQTTMAIEALQQGYME